MSKFINSDEFSLTFLWDSTNFLQKIFIVAIITISDYCELVLAFFQYKNEMKALRDAHLIFKILSL